MEFQIPKKDCKTQIIRYPQKAAWSLRKILMKVLAGKVKFQNHSISTNKYVYYTGLTIKNKFI